MQQNLAELRRTVVDLREYIGRANQGPTGSAIDRMLSEEAEQLTRDCRDSYIRDPSNRAVSHLAVLYFDLLGAPTNREEVRTQLQLCLACPELPATAKVIVDAALASMEAFDRKMDAIPAPPLVMRLVPQPKKEPTRVKEEPAPAQGQELAPAPAQRPALVPEQEFEGQEEVMIKQERGFEEQTQDVEMSSAEEDEDLSSLDSDPDVQQSVGLDASLRDTVYLSENPVCPTDSFEEAIAVLFERTARVPERVKNIAKILETIKTSIHISKDALPHVLDIIRDYALHEIAIKFDEKRFPKGLLQLVLLFESKMGNRNGMFYQLDHNDVDNLRTLRKAIAMQTSLKDSIVLRDYTKADPTQALPLLRSVNGCINKDVVYTPYIGVESNTRDRDGLRSVYGRLERVSWSPCVDLWDARSQVLSFTVSQYVSLSLFTSLCVGLFTSFSLSLSQYILAYLM